MYCSDGKLICCRDCFMRYIATKVLKRLETNRIRGGFNDEQKTVLVPVSFGVSSICLLHLLDQQLRNRAEQGRHAGYSLHILFVDQYAIVGPISAEQLVNCLTQRFPSHAYTSISLEECNKYGISFEEVSNGGQKDLKHILSSLPSPTSRVDFVEIARRRLILAFAKKHGCNSILFGDSTTRLAERALSETAKGRGGVLPWLTTDSPYTDAIPCIYPMRDLLRKELSAYAGVTSPPLTSLVLEDSKQAPASSKDVTIDGLMSQYFESVEQNYPSIVANVVRTSGKLVPQMVAGGTRTCPMCEHPILTELWGGEQHAVGSLQPAEDVGGPRNNRPLCYGCARTVPKP